MIFCDNKNIDKFELYNIALLLIVNAALTYNEVKINQDLIKNR